jgi:glucokinase
MRASGMRRVNSALLLDMIREKGPVSRAELARLSGLTKPTVSSQVADLVKRGIVVEDGEGEPDARGGKPPMMLRFDSGAGMLAAAEIGSSAVRVWLADLDGRRLGCETFATDPEKGASRVLNVLISGIQGLLKRHRRSNGKLLCVSVAAPGRVNARSGIVLEAGNVFHWKDIPVASRIEERLGARTVVENDVNLAALGEMHSGIAAGAENFVLIRLGTGIGAGLVLGGRLYQGTHWAAGEIAHMVFDRASAIEDATDRGLLESAIGSDRILERVRTARSGQWTDGSLLPNMDVAGELGNAVRRNDPIAARIVDDVAAQLSITVADLAATVDPELVVLAGDLFGLVIDRIRELVGRVIPWPMRIELSELGADAALMGAMGVARGEAHDLICDWGREEVRLTT